MGAMPDPHDVYEAHLVAALHANRKEPTTMGEMSDDHDIPIRDLDGAYAGDTPLPDPRHVSPSGLVTMLFAVTPSRSRAAQHTHDLIEEYEERLVALRRKRRFLEAMPADDPNVDGDVLLIRRSFDDSDIQYIYAAVRGGDLYHLTGGSSRTPQRINWTELVEWLSTDPDCEVRKVTAVSGPFQWTAEVTPPPAG